MTDVSLAPLDIGVEFTSPVILPFNIEVQLNVGLQFPVPLIANNWNGYELGNVRLDRITRFEMSPGLNNGGPESVNFQRFYQKNTEETEKSINAVGATINVLQRAIEDIAAAQATAQEAALEAEAVRKEQNLVSSYVEPTNIVTGFENGDVVVAPHTRNYGDGRQVSVDGATLTGFAAGEVVRPFYDDFEQVGGSVIWQSSTSGVFAQSNGIHLVGFVTIPVASAPPSSGAPSYPPGFNIIGDVL